MRTSSSATPIRTPQTASSTPRHAKSPHRKMLPENLKALEQPVRRLEENRRLLLFPQQGFPLTPPLSEVKTRSTKIATHQIPTDQRVRTARRRDDRIGNPCSMQARSRRWPGSDMRIPHRISDVLPLAQYSRSSQCAAPRCVRDN